VNELLSLEPRVAGEDVAEPETDLTYRSEDEHTRCICLGTQCATGLAYTGTAGCEAGEGAADD
jgi:hypothetical protein